MIWDRIWSRQQAEGIRVNQLQRKLWEMRPIKIRKPSERWREETIGSRHVSCFGESRGRTGQSFSAFRFGRSGSSGINLCAEPMRAVDRQRYDCRIAGWKIKAFCDQKIPDISLVALEGDKKRYGYGCDTFYCLLTE